MLFRSGLKEYNVYGLLRDNHGLNINEYSWLKFDGEDIGWDDIKVRD